MGELRVLQAMAGAKHGGAETFFMRLVPALARAGLEQRVVIRRDPERATALRVQGLEPLELAFGGILDFTTRRRLRHAIETYAPDLVMTWMNRATVLCPPWRSTGSRFVHVARLGGYYDLKYYRRCDHLVGNTPDIVAYLVASGWPKARAHYLPNFVDAVAAEAVPRASLATPEDAPLVLALGRLHRNKAFDVLLKAMTQVPGAHLWLAGEGSERRELEREAEWLGLGERVHFLGWRDDAPALYAAADLLVCPSRREPLGNVVIEGWAHGVPVVAAASEGPRAYIEDGKSGLLAPVDDAGELARAMRRVIEDKALAASLVGGGRIAYTAQFTESAAVARYLEFYRRVAA
jgi:glycosyltransferase involved in cell wall biosynthesis